LVRFSLVNERRKRCWEVEKEVIETLHIPLCTSHFAHPRVKNIVTISGQLGDDAKRYQERIVKYAGEESQK
jgi:hypothetical protein